MILNKALELLNQYAKCPGCGSEQLGKDEGTLEVSGNSLTRVCKCGFFVGIDLGKEEN